MNDTIPDDGMTRFPLLRRLSITSLAAMLLTAGILILLYRQDQYAEHESIARQENEKTAIHLTHLLDEQIYTLISSSKGLSPDALRANPDVVLFGAAVDQVREHHVIKLKIYNPSGIAVYSSVGEEIGVTSKHLELLAKALAGETRHQLQFQTSILSPSGLLHERYIANTYMPLTHDGKNSGVIEIYADATPIIERIFSKTLSIALVVLGAFATLYAALFFSVLKTDRAVEKWRKALAENARALAASERQFRTLAEAMPQIVWIAEPDGQNSYFNQQWVDYTGLTLEASHGYGWNTPIHPDDSQRARDAWQQAMTSDGVYTLECRLRSKDGAYRWWLVRGVSLHDENGKVLKWFGTCTDIDDMKQAGLALSESEERLRATIETSMDAVVQMDAEGEITGWNSQTEGIFGWSREEAIGRALHELIIPHRHREAHVKGLKHFLLTHEGVILNKRIEIEGLHRDGHEFPIELTVAPIKMGGKHEFSAFLRDITSKKRSEEIIWKQANFDELTSLPNRHMLHDRMGHEIRKTKRAGLKIALLFIDLDRFKEVNDTLGHDMGDLLLVEAARRITECVRTTDIVARLGGDEFTVMLAEIDEISSVERVAQNIIAQIAAPVSLKQEVVYISASIGVTLYPDDAEEIEDLFRNADQAMYVAKDLGRNRHSYFTRALQEVAQSRLRLINDLRGALAAGQFRVYFQPIVELATNDIHKAEALIRWQHPEQGMIRPIDFIPLAEDTGLIFEIGDWVFEESMRWVKRWRSLYNPALQISVNKSPLQFYKDGDEHSAWLTHLHEMGLPGQCLAIEITEGLMLDSNASINGALLTLRNADIQVAIDDFGTGYSSLSYLKKFDIDYLKIDQSFVHNLATDQNDLALCEAIIVMAHKLGIKVIAEGVETKQQRDLLAAAGCDYAQGYFYARPASPEAFEALLARGISWFSQEALK